MNKIRNLVKFILIIASFQCLAENQKIIKKAIVCGAGGFIGNHLVSRLKKDGYWVRGVDLKFSEFSKSAS